MSFNKFIKLKLVNKTTEGIVDLLIKLQDSLERSLQFFVDKPQLDSKLLTNITITQGVNQIPHTLGHRLLGWQIIRQRNSYGIFFDLQDISAAPNTYLYLMASDPCVVDILVF